MRTVIFLGLLAIADAIKNDRLNKDSIEFLAIILFVAIIMDVFEFFKKMSSNN